MVIQWIECPDRVLDIFFPDFPTPLNVSLTSVCFSGQTVIWLTLLSCTQSPGSAEPRGEDLGTNSLGEARPARKKNVVAFGVM